MAKKRKPEPAGTGRGEMLRLLEAAKQEPWDDAPRLLLADWLEEHGGEADRARAEIIRLEIDQANGGPWWLGTVDRLLERHASAFVGRFGAFFAGRRVPYGERGFLMAEGTVKDWLSGVPDDEVWPWVDLARIQAIKPSQVPRLVASGLMATVPRLKFAHDCPLGPAGLREAARSPSQGGVRSLCLTVPGDQLAAFAEALRPGLDELRMFTWRLTSAGWSAFCGSPGVAGLSGLSLDVPDLDDEGAARLAGAPGLASLRRLALVRNRLRGEGLSRLARLGLERLTLGRPEFGADSLGRLAGTRCAETLERLSVSFRARRKGTPALPPENLSLPRLRRLAIRGLAGREVMERLAGWPMLGGLEELDLVNNDFKGEGLDPLLGSGHPGPRTLNLLDCGLGDDGVRRLAAWPGLATVRCLRLGRNGVGDEGLLALAGSPHTASLEALALGENRTSAARGLTALLRSPLGARLRWLGFEGDMTKGSVRAVAENAGPGLRELQVGHPLLVTLGQDGLAALRARLPECAIG
jgi:uncharacterized protein (TIGR02996 family)